MWQFDSEFTDIIQRTPSVKSFHLPIHIQNAPYKPGQFFFLTIKINGQEAVHHFTISSSPTDQGYIEFTKRITPHEFSQALDNMSPGDWAHLQGPAGEFVLPSEGSKIAFLTGGIGITPVRSMLRYISHQKLNYDVVLLYGNGSAEEIVFRDELEEIVRSNHSIRVVHVLSGPNIPPDWTGKTGFINKDLVMELVPDYMDRLFYMSGPPKMVMILVEQISALKVPQEHIFRDSFTGYD
ncbi:Ferredoxin-NADP reductase [Dehalogenimonas formicexedens]|uniref:Ferredoxin-NADP reductase n=1 Tax=Dehalogenimonas formicexedens TaxID=1839801 RepID=A0A1P8F5H1_9CHLR|nr:FAD-binding oxidoreductase [Dehalogenimonas formicexedens]APV43724.1 Ferredoxin-NADP reductase [Dehalogenimonas formicexedens]